MDIEAITGLQTFRKKMKKYAKSVTKKKSFYPSQASIKCAFFFCLEHSSNLFDFYICRKGHT